MFVKNKRKLRESVRILNWKLRKLCLEETSVRLQRRGRRTFPRSQVWLETRIPGSWHPAQRSFHSITQPPWNTSRQTYGKEAMPHEWLDCWGKGLQGWGGVKAWRIIWFYRNLFASRYCSYQGGCPKERTTDWQQEQRHGQSHEGRHKSHSASCVPRIYFKSRPR